MFEEPPSNFVIEINMQNRKAATYFSAKNCVILASDVLSQYTCTTLYMTDILRHKLKFAMQLQRSAIKTTGQLTTKLKCTSRKLQTH